MLENFKKFFADKHAPDMYITGIAGTGKTTSLGEILEYCIANNIKAVTCAYTHKAVGVLTGKLPEQAVLQTLHSFLTKRPTINDTVTKLAYIASNVSSSVPELVEVIFIDEYSMVGERDYTSLAEVQYNDDGDLVTKIVYIGDPNQLPPVKDMQTIVPTGKYCYTLTEVKRQTKNNPLIDTLTLLNDFINGKKPTPLTEHAKFVRGVNIVNEYKKCNADKVLLAYTNKRVQLLNEQIQGYSKPRLDDSLFSPTTKEKYLYLDTVTAPQSIVGVNGELIEIGSKYKTLEKLLKLPVDFYELEHGDIQTTKAVVFGHQNYLDIEKELANKAVAANATIFKKYKINPKLWALQNYSHKDAKHRAKVWADYITFKTCVICVDFDHATTVHKSQGSTYDTVFIDTEDLGKCADNDYTLYLKLLYVAISRASNKVYTN